MKRFVIALVVVAAAASCSLNPQPFPPDNPDGAVTGLDAGKGGDATFGNDAAGTVPDAAEDTAPVPESDGGADASDALVDAPNDVIVDVALDVALDVGTD
jgi:hypothetical protein